MSTIGLPIMVSFTVFVPSIVARQFGSCMLLYKISPLLSCLHDKFSVVVHTLSPAAHIVHCFCFFLWSKLCFHWKMLSILYNMFVCYNINCYSTFRTERGLHQHLFRNAGCQQYMITMECILMVLLMTMKKEEDKHHCCAGVHHIV